MIFSLQDSRSIYTTVSMMINYTFFFFFYIFKQNKGRKTQKKEKDDISRHYSYKAVRITVELQQGTSGYSCCSFVNRVAGETWKKDLHLKTFSTTTATAKSVHSFSRLRCNTLLCFTPIEEIDEFLLAAVQRVCCNTTLGVHAVNQHSGCLCCYAALWMFTLWCKTLGVYAVVQHWVFMPLCNILCLCCYATLWVFMLSCKRSEYLCCHATLWVFMSLCNILCVYAVMQTGCLCCHATLWVFMLSCNILGVYADMQHPGCLYCNATLNTSTPSPP